MLACGESRECAGKARYRAHYLYGAHREDGLRRAVPVVVSEVGGKAVDHDYGRRVAAAFRAVGECTGGKHNEHDGRKNECYGFLHVCSSLYGFTALKSKERGHKVGDDRHNYSRYKNAEDNYREGFLYPHVGQGSYQCSGPSARSGQGNGNE